MTTAAKMVKIESTINQRITKNANMIVPFYLMCSYAYYELDDPIVSDSYYDKLATKLLKEYHNIEHYHKHLIIEDDLKAGSFLGKYPSIVSDALNNFINQKG